MCLWILTACLGLLPTSPPTSSPVIVVPAPILPATTTTTTTRTIFPPATLAPQGPGNIPFTTLPPPSTITNPTTAQTPAPAPTNPPSQMMTNKPATGGVIVPLILCDKPDLVCFLNPKTALGPLQIDPRLGTTSAPRARLMAPSDSAVRFPREKRSVDYGTSIKDYISQLRLKEHVRNKRQACACVPTGTCPTTGINYGAGMIDIRIVTPGAQCPAGQTYCCTSGSPATVRCGVQQTVPSTGVTPAAGQASFGEYPWQALIMSAQNDYIAGGVLIDQLNVLTVTHRLAPYIVGNTAPNVKVRLGEWDAAGGYEPIPFQEYTVQKVFSHPSYNPSTLQYDITVLRLSRPVPLTPMTGAAATINRACLPPAATSVYTGQRCYVSGWGKNMFGIQGQYQQILKEVDVPIVASATCQAQMQAARLGATFTLDTTSFICAGGEANKDSCTGDGGSGLVCPVNGQWVVIGLVAWGLGCANPNVPAAYVNIASLLPWIQQQVATP